MSSASVANLTKRFPQFDEKAIEKMRQSFKKYDADSDGGIDTKELYNALNFMGHKYSYDDVRATIKSVDMNASGTVEFDEFVEVLAKLSLEGKPEQTDAFAGLHNKGALTVKGANANTAHTMNHEEKAEFVNHINQALKNDKDIGKRFPLDKDTMQLFDECKDGLLLSKLINDAVPDTIDERVLNKGTKLSKFQQTENNNVVINSAKAIGCNVVNIGSADLIEGREHLILGLVWQIIKIGLLAKIDIKFHPELYRLLEKGELLEDFLKLPPDQILLRWFNFHLKAAGWNKKVTNFTSDIKDGENYTILLNQLVPEKCSKVPLQQPNLLQRAEMVLDNADKIECRKYLTPKTLTEGNAKLNLAFVAHLFNTHPGLAPLSEQEKSVLDEWLFSSEGDREARAFALWLNSLGVEPFVNNLFDDLRDGLILLQAIDKVKPGVVEWRKVNSKTPITSKFKRVENCNYVIILGKSLKFSLVAIGGSDITDGIKKLTLALVWQLMREHVVQTLKSLSTATKEITDADMIEWANKTVKASGKSSTMSSFRDPSLGSGLFFLDLLNGMRKGIVDFQLVTNGQGDDNAKLNAKYAISIARKLGATIFCLPEDIIEVKAKMNLTFVGALMAVGLGSNRQAQE